MSYEMDFERHGLCATCDRVFGCGWASRATAPTHHCSDFSARGRGAPVRPHEPVAATRIDTSIGGICVDCDHRRGCGFRLAPGSVWRCEEYA